MRKYQGTPPLLIFQPLIAEHYIVPYILFILCVGYFIFYPIQKSNKSLPTSAFLRPIKQQVEVVSLVRRQACYESFTISPVNQGYNYQASWFSCKALNIHVGDILDSTFILKPIHSSHSPGAFDTEQWAIQNSIVAQATIKSAIKVGEAHKFSLEMQRLREQLDDITRSRIHDSSVTAVIESLTLGITHNLSWETLQSFNLSGTRHLLAISGSHIAMVAVFAYAFFFMLTRVLIIFFPSMNAHTVAIALSVIIVGFYVGLSGGQVPTLRAFFMALVALIAVFLHRYSSLLYRIFVAAIIIFFIDPHTLDSPSFYLSFYAVFLIAYHQLWGLKSASKIMNYFKLNMLLLLGLIPISLYFFSQYAFIALLANLIAIPWVGCIILPGSIILQWLGYCGYSCEVLWRCLEWLTQLFVNTVAFFSHITLHVPGMFLIGHISLFCAVLTSLLVLFLFLPKGAPARYLGIFALLPLLFSHSQIKPNSVEIIFMNVGQGLSVLVKTQKHLMIYDTGPKFFTGGDVAQSIILPYLYYQGWRKIDVLMVSHGDADHAGGAKTLRNYTQVTTVLSSDTLRVPGATLCQSGQHWRWDGVDFDVLYPDLGHLHKGNNSSCVLKISVNRNSVLLVGDIEASTERYLVTETQDRLAATVLSVPHHGSKTSSSEIFLSAVHPDYAVFSYGFLNRFHFPSPAIVQRYQRHAINSLVTESGPVSIKVSAFGVTIGE